MPRPDDNYIMNAMERLPIDGTRPVLDILHHEHAFAQPLLERLVELGNGLLAGESVEPRTVLFGVALLDAYLHRVHVGEEDRELRPEAERVAMPMCFAHLDDITLNHDEMRNRTRRLLSDIRRWKSGAEEARPIIAKELVDLASRDYEAVRYEEDYPFSCLQTELPEDAEGRLRDRLGRHARTRTALESNIQRYLAGTFKT